MFGIQYKPIFVPSHLTHTYSKIQEEEEKNPKSKNKRHKKTVLRDRLNDKKREKENQKNKKKKNVTQIAEKKQ